MTGPCSCGATPAHRFQVLHHLPCAYVGPSYDFVMSGGVFICPKCDISFTTSGRDGEVLGYALRCPTCGAEWLEDINT